MAQHNGQKEPLKRSVIGLGYVKDLENLRLYDGVVDLGINVFRYNGTLLNFIVKNIIF